MAAAKKNGKKQTKETQAVDSSNHLTNLPALNTGGAIVQPVVGAAGIVAALQEYKKLQAGLDEAMPDQLLDIRGKVFRKKGYWRAIRTAFNLNVEQVQESEKRLEVGGDDWGYTVTYRATAPNGTTAEGDGCCMASEKTGRDGSNYATEHNVRSHAHTRAFNRAVSNLVGFGEVSAEEAYDDEGGGRPRQQQQRQQGNQQQGQQQQGGGNAMSENHIKLKEEIEKLVKDEGMPDGYKAMILKQCTAFETADGRKFTGVVGYDFSKLSSKAAFMALKQFNEDKAGAVEMWRAYKAKQPQGETGNG